MYKFPVFNSPEEMKLFALGYIEIYTVKLGYNVLGYHELPVITNK
jgi:hypothetical protein